VDRQGRPRRVEIVRAVSTRPANRRSGLVAGGRTPHDPPDHGGLPAPHNHQQPPGNMGGSAPRRMFRRMARGRGGTPDVGLARAKYSGHRAEGVALDRRPGRNGAGARRQSLAIPSASPVQPRASIARPVTRERKTEVHRRRVRRLAREQGRYGYRAERQKASAAIVSGRPGLRRPKDSQGSASKRNDGPSRGAVPVIGSCSPSDRSSDRVTAPDKPRHMISALFARSIGAPAIRAGQRQHQPDTA